MHSLRRLTLLLVTSLACMSCLAVAQQPIDWKSLPKDPAVLTSPEALAIADNLLAYQYKSGGWPKNIAMEKNLTDADRAALASRDETKRDGEHTPTIDNGATTSQIRFLAAVFTATGHERHRDAVLRGLDYLFTAQYENGGWPQFFPLRKGYYTHITFNDDATRNVLEILRDTAAAKAPYAFVDEPRRIRATDALARGIACVLRCQIVVDGKPTVWAAQHDETTFAPAPARKFEPACFTSQESAGLVRFLMSLENPSPEIIASVQGAVAWFERTKLSGLRFERVKTPEGRDGIVTPDPAAPPLWARFYELGTERPIFIGRDEVIHYTLSEIERERRGGYAWYDDRPAEILKKYPSWLNRNVKP
ncbi:pectate lyase [Nibricoccus aquaticus]|uniref:Pectate lyase n=1 Tax=Nibricoccus aquaticus TaxID=2576891 RepID=A0A290Q8A7_9BACT|nr:pectate lyase [Nibricoccus aquaticus]ATC64673.1 pectate lyase [Nibricoccus aquaticus]